MTSSRFEQSLSRGKVEERKVAEYLKALGYRVLPTTDFSANGAPKLEAANDEESLVMPDLQAFKDGTGEWFEVKFKSEATWSDRHGRLETGTDGIAYERYCRIEAETKIPVAVVFVHEAEKQVRCGTLNQLAEAFSHTSDRMGRGGMRFWIFERIPLWMTFDELSAAIEAHRHHARLIKPIPAPTDNTLMPAQLGRRSHALRKHVDNERAPASKLSPPWTWTCLPCNVTGTGEPSRHRCTDTKGWCRDYWIHRFRWAMPTASKEDLAALVDRPITRARMIELFGSRWLPEGDAR